MKEKIKALIGRLRKKPSADGSPVARAPIDKKAILKRTSMITAWTFGILLFVCLSITLGLNFWFHRHPLSSYKSEIVSYIKNSTGAESVEFKDLDWCFALGSLSIGLQAQNFVIQKMGSVESMNLQRIRLLVEPLKLLRGKLPVRIEGRDGLLHIGDQSSEKKGPRKTLPAKQSSVLHLSLLLEGIDVDADSEIFGLKATEASFRAHESKLKLDMSGLPGPFTLNIESVLDAHSELRHSVAKGPVSFKLKGDFQFSGDQPVGVSADLHGDFKELGLLAFAVFDKSPGLDLESDMQIQALLDSDYTVRSVGVKTGEFRYEQIKVGIAGDFSARSKFGFQWSLPKTEVNRLHLPIAYLHNVPVKGIVESKGNLNFYGHDGVSLSWKSTLNNLRIDAADLSEYIDPSSNGELNLSAVSEGSIVDGQISSPRTEFQLEGDNCQLEISKGKIIKPMGDELKVLFKASIKEDRLVVSNFRTNLHTMDLEGTGSLDGFSKILVKQPAEIKVDLQSNSIDLVRWSSYFPLFRKLPLEGFVQFGGSVNGIVRPGEDPFKDLLWRVDRVSLSKVHGAFDRESMSQLDIDSKDLELNGPFMFDFLFQGRGKGSVVYRGTLTSQIDFSRVNIFYKSYLRKLADVPFVLDLFAEQSRSQLSIKKGLFRFADLLMNFSGDIFKGSSRSFVDLRMAHPINLSDWRQFFVRIPTSVPFDGKIDWRGKVGFNQREAMEGDLDWKDFSLNGELNVDGLRYQFNEFKYPLLGGHGELLVGEGGITIPNLDFDMGPGHFHLSGEAKPLNPLRSKNASTLAKLFGEKAWDVSAEMSGRQMSPEIFDAPASKTVQPINITEDDTPTFGQRLKALLRWPRFQNSRVKLRLVSKGASSKTLSYADANALLEWDKNVFRLQPFSLRTWGGKISGSIDVDARPFYNQKEAPQAALSLKLDGVNLSEMLKRWHPAVNGNFSGEAVLTTQGFETDDLVKALRGRIQGELSQVQMNLFSPIKKAMDDFMTNSDAKDYFLGHSHKEKCLEGSIRGQADIQLGAHGIDIQKADFEYASGSRISLLGGLGAEGSLLVEGQLDPGKACVVGEAHRCLLEQNDPEALLFHLKGRLEKPDFRFESEGLSQSMIQCMEKHLAANARSSINRAAASPEVRRQDAKEAKKIKAIFRNSDPQ